jgi:hypothetical protein
MLHLMLSTSSESVDEVSVSDELLRRRPAFLFMLFRCSSISVAFLKIWSMYIILVERMVVSCKLT